MKDNSFIDECLYHLADREETLHFFSEVFFKFLFMNYTILNKPAPI